VAVMARAPEQGNWLDEIAELVTDYARKRFFRRRRWLNTFSAVEQLYDEVVRLSRIDLDRAAGLAKTAQLLASEIEDDAARALAIRARGHILHLSGRHVDAVSAYDSAITLYQRLGRDLDIARTYSGALHTLIYLGRYSRAISWAQKARATFKKHGDRLRLARLDVNLGNIYYRRDQFEKALQLYDRAYRQFQRSAEPQDVAITLRNIAVCHISLNQFARALKVYIQARAHCERYGLRVLVAEADYNIAYLYYLRGEYTMAIQMYEAARQRSQEVGDIYHRAMCDLDQAELYLELNLNQDAARLAEHALGIFESLRMRYEAAKALTFLAIAEVHRRQTKDALNLLQRARQLFTQEKNRVWCALLDFYQAMILYWSGNDRESRHYCQMAMAFFAGSKLRTKAALCELLIAQLDLRSGELARSKQFCLRALRRLHRAETPVIDYQAWFVLGQIQESLHDESSATRSYKKAHEKLRALRGQLHAEAKISFQQDKLKVYEKLVRLLLKRPTGSRQLAAFSYIEQAKSRSLADLISFRSLTRSRRDRDTNNTLQQAVDLRQELNWIYRRIDLEGIQASKYSWEHIRNLQQRGRVVSKKLEAIMPRLNARDEQSASVHAADVATLEEIRSAIREHTLLLEYYIADEAVYVVVLGSDSFQVVQLRSAAQIQRELQFLDFQLAKFRLGEEYLRNYSALMRAASEAHLHALYRALISPVRHLLQCKHLVIVPHAFLHRLPFHALFDGERYLIDSYSISYAPSASVYHLCSRTKPSKSLVKSAVIGVLDPRTPHIQEEVEAVAAQLPNARILLGPDATVEQLRRAAAESRFLHIATHGEFRTDNPMFSSIRLTDSFLSVYDFYDLRLRAELVTLSGCGTGLSVVTSGDELLGLVRGLLYSGTRAVLLTLWDVNDQSTAEFMKCFYARMATSDDKSEALRGAVQELRDSYPDVYHWAPFVLVGKLDR
jgi:CHAT domain-containing protein/tetratricopeptide (TPR) repeat protein